MLGQPIGLPNPATNDEVVEGRPWWKVCCAGCCLGIVVIVLFALFGFRLFADAGPRTVQSLPDTYPKELVFRPELAAEILYYPASSKNAVSRIVTGPLDWITSVAGGRSTSTAATVRGLSTHLKQVEGRDSVSIHWVNLPATRDEVLRFYAGALRQMGISNVQTTNPNGTWEVRLTGAGGRGSVDLLIADDPAKDGIDDLTVVAEYPIKL